MNFFFFLKSKFYIEARWRSVKHNCKGKYGDSFSGPSYPTLRKFQVFKGIEESIPKNGVISLANILLGAKLRSLA